ncbi:MAG TPA: PAS domain S-box protein, partial [Rectinema sp.]|nr:PAS domain S-box protein [Rectinema sp.]
MKLDASILKDFFLDSSLSDFFKEIDIFYIDFLSHTAQSCTTLRSLGYEDADLLKVMENFPVHESDRDRANLQLQRIWSGQIETFIDAFRLASKDGSSYRWLRFTVKVLLRNSEKRPKIVVGHVVDLDDLITSQEEIRERLVEIDTMRELFTAINKSLDFSETFSRTIDQLRRIIPFDRSCVESLEDGRLIAVAGYGYNESDLSGLVFPAHGVENPAVRAIEERRIVIC